MKSNTINHYNDLERRRQHLCKLINNACSRSAIIQLLNELVFVPLPEKGH
jgi:hypothetical protein